MNEREMRTYSGSPGIRTVELKMETTHVNWDVMRQLFAEGKRANKNAKRLLNARRMGLL